MPLPPTGPKRQRWLREHGYIDPRTGELNERGETLAEEMYGDLWDDDDDSYYGDYGYDPGDNF